MSSKDIKATIEKDCIKCNQCYDSCSMLQELGEGFFCLLENDALKNGKNKCTLCSLCNEVCPMNLDIKGYYSELKKEGSKPLLIKYADHIHKKRLRDIDE